MRNASYLNRKMIAFVLAAVMTATVGCGSDQNANGQTDDADIVLEDPVGVAENYDYVTLRDLYDYEIYNTSVNPSVTEYAFNTDQTFKKYGFTPGSEVNPGDELVLSKTESLDKQIADKEEEIANFEEDHAAEMDALNKDIYDAKQREFEASEGVTDMLAWEPDEENQKDFYDMWASLYMLPDGVYKRAIQNRLELEENQRQCEELYNLDHDYMTDCLERLKNKITDATIISDVEGEIVSCGYYVDGDSIAKDTPVIAVGDTNSRVLKTEYISKGMINQAEDIYAVIDGERYEVEYVNMEPEEYTQLTEQGETAYTTFNLIDPENKVELGQYAVIVMVKDKRTQVPCIPVDALNKESDGYYVHVLDGDETKYVAVEIGMKEGKYAEVLSGVSVGDQVLSESGVVKGKKTAVLEKGDYQIDKEIGGYLYYPFSEWLVNPVQSGDTYVKEILVSNYEKVTEGQTLVTLEAIPDQVEIDRLNRQISRLQTRLAKLQATKSDNDARNIIDRSVERSISSNIIQTSRLNRQLSKLQEYSGIIEIKAPYDGIVLDAETIKVGDLLYADSNVVRIADDTMSYILIKDEEGVFNYGNKAAVKAGKTSTEVLAEGKIANVSNICLSKKMAGEYSLVAIPEEETSKISGSALSEEGKWERSTFKLTVTIRSMKNVVLVPKAAVTTESGISYVRVIKDDGSVEQVSFIPGGSDNNYYWVAEGLTEGMTICWE